MGMGGERTTAESIAQQPPRTLQSTVPLWALLAGLGAIGWVITVRQARDMGAGPGTMGMALPLFAGMWVAMMAAMMLPAVGPLASWEVALAPRPRAVRAPAAIGFAAGFLAPWAAYGLVLFPVLIATGHLADHSPEAAKWLGVGLYGLAGLYQFTPWKRWALEHCRMPMHRRGGDGLAGDLASGALDGATCVGCCWAFMLVLIPAGVMNLTAMVGLAAVIFAEKILPRPRLVMWLVGAGFLLLAVLAAGHPSLLPGLSSTGMGMSAGGM